MFDLMSKGLQAYKEEMDAQARGDKPKDYRRPTRSMYVDHWRHKEPAEYALKMMKVFGRPHYSTHEMVGWKEDGDVAKMVVKDEFLAHGFPKLHHDFVYSYINLHVPVEFVGQFAEVTESIVIDRLVPYVYARCGSLFANATTLGFVLDVVQGKVKPSKKEYSRRILGGVIPDWYEDRMNEG